MITCFNIWFMCNGVYKMFGILIKFFHLYAIKLKKKTANAGTNVFTI